MIWFTSSSMLRLDNYKTPDEGHGRHDHTYFREGPHRWRCPFPPRDLEPQHGGQRTDHGEVGTEVQTEEQAVGMSRELGGQHCRSGKVIDQVGRSGGDTCGLPGTCLLYTSDAADDLL